MGKVRADTKALDFAIREELKNWSGINPELIPIEVRKHYDFINNRMVLTNLSLEDKMLVWGAISPNHQAFVYFAKDGVPVQEKDLKYWNDTPQDFKDEDEIESANGVVISDKNVFKFLQRMAMVFNSRAYNEYLSLKISKGILTDGRNKQDEYVDFIKLLFFNSSFRLSQNCARYGITLNEFNLLIGCSVIDNFRIDGQAENIYRIVGRPQKRSKLYKTSNALLKKGLIKKVRHSRFVLLDSTIEGEEVLRKILTELTQYEYYFG